MSGASESESSSSGELLEMDGVNSSSSFRVVRCSEELGCENGAESGSKSSSVN